MSDTICPTIWRRRAARNSAQCSDPGSPTPQAPSLRSLVRLAMKCDSAEEMGRKLKQRFDRQRQRQGIAIGCDRAAEAELDRLLGQD